MYKWDRGIVRIGSIIIFHLSKLWKAKFFILCDVIFLVRLQRKFENTVKMRNDLPAVQSHWRRRKSLAQGRATKASFFYGAACALRFFACVHFLLSYALQELRSMSRSNHMCQLYGVKNRIEMQGKDRLFVQSYQLLHRVAYGYSKIVSQGRTCLATHD